MDESLTNMQAVIIGSTPGYHKGEDMQKWGLKRLQYVLTKKVDITPECQKNSIVLTQVGAHCRHTSCAITDLPKVTFSLRVLANSQKSGLLSNFHRVCKAAATP